MVTETLAGLDRLAKQDGQGPRPKLAAKIGILREIGRRSAMTCRACATGRHCC
jgi:hypothetical protein